jgi:hypothetical protein
MLSAHSRRKCLRSGLIDSRQTPNIRIPGLGSLETRTCILEHPGPYGALRAVASSLVLRTRTQQEIVDHKRGEPPYLLPAQEALQSWLKPFIEQSGADFATRSFSQQGSVVSYSIYCSGKSAAQPSIGVEREAVYKFGRLYAPYFLRLPR